MAAVRHYGFIPLERLLVTGKVIPGERSPGLAAGFLFAGAKTLCAAGPNVLKIFAYRC